MKKNNSKKMILAAMLFFSGGFILPLGKFETANAAQEEQIDLDYEGLSDEKETGNQEQEMEEKEAEEKSNEMTEQNGDLKDDSEETEEKGEIEEGETEKGETEAEEEEREKLEESKEGMEGKNLEEIEEIEKENKEEGKLEETEESKEEEKEQEEIGKIEEENRGEGKLEETEEPKEEEREQEEIGKIEEENREEGKLEETEEPEMEEKEQEEIGKIEEENKEEGKFEQIEEVDEEQEENEEELVEFINGACNVNSAEIIQVDNEILKEHFISSAEMPETVVVKQIITEQVEETAQTEDTVAVTLEQNTMTEIRIDESLEKLDSNDNSSLELTEDLKIPVASIERLENLNGEKELRFYYQMDEENLVEHQIKVFLNSGGKEELICQEDNLTEGEMVFEEEGTYLVYLYTKDNLGNESRIYQNYTVGSFEINLEELNQFDNKEIEVEDMEMLLEDVFQGSNVATYQLYINGEQYKGEPSQIPEGKCILTVEMEDTHGNSGQKTIEVIAVNNKQQEENSGLEMEKTDTKGQGGEKEQKKETESKEKNDTIKNDDSQVDAKKDSSIPVQAAGILGSLISGMLILFRRIKH